LSVDIEIAVEEVGVHYYSGKTYTMGAVTHPISPARLKMLAMVWSLDWYRYGDSHYLFY
jgi:hypothetical protein